MFQKFLDECFYSFELTKLQFSKFLEKIKKVAYSFLYLNPQLLAIQMLIEEKVPGSLALRQQLDEMLHMPRVDMILKSLHSFYY